MKVFMPKFSGTVSMIQSHRLVFVCASCTYKPFLFARNSAHSWDPIQLTWISMSVVRLGEGIRRIMCHILILLRCAYLCFPGLARNMVRQWIQKLSMLEFILIWKTCTRNASSPLSRNLTKLLKLDTRTEVGVMKFSGVSWWSTWWNARRFLFQWTMCLCNTST